MTHIQLEHFSNRIGRYFRTRPFSHFDSIAVVMENCPEYIGIWLGLSKAGFVAALINTNLRHDMLLHSINAAGCKAIIFGSEFKDGKTFFYLHCKWLNFRDLKAGRRQDLICKHGTYICLLFTR